MKLLSVEHLSKSFGGLTAVNDVSFSVDTGMIKGIIGPNGAGKTTLFNLIAGALSPDTGTVHFADKPIHGLPQHRIAERRIARTFQNIKLFPHMTVLENVIAGRHTRTKAGFIAGMLSLPHTLSEETKAVAASRDILDLLGIAALADKEAGSLPFGRQRVVEFARALALDPELILLDEPAAGLNNHETDEIAAIIRRIRDLGITVLIIEHDMSLIMEISDSILVLSSGKQIAEGPPSEIQRNREVINVYLGAEDA
ncbi:MAG: ABC transporter ATP-binding protein [Spirochaetes bacterium]|nr:ABC transporter ATP-binding protein [Spirochaetota bacterium]